MKLLTKAIETKLRENGRNRDQDHEPALKLFNPFGAATWLITELDEDGDTMFGLCDLGMGSPELGYVSLSEIRSVRGPLGLGIERDLHFKANKPISVYADEARSEGRIVA